MTSAISITNVGFQYAENSGVMFNNLNLNIAAGERFGLLGPNGAGKTTLINLMTGVLRASEGSIRLMGKDILLEKKEVSSLFGFVPQFHSFYQELSPAENLEFFGALSGLSKPTIKKRTDELLEVLGLSNVRNKPVSKFSGGMKNRVNLAIGVIHQPKILFLDEPTNGVDVQARHAIINYLKELNAAGTTLVYTSHHLSEAQSLCTRIALIDDGKIITQGDLNTLLIGHEKDGLEGLFLGLTGKEYRDQ